VLTGSRSSRATLGLLVLAAGLLFGSHVRAEEEAAKSEESTEELTKKTQNPVADLISVPFQSNFNFGAGPRHALLYVLNVQPVVPIKLTEGWNLITRTIVPIISQGSLAPGIDHVGGLGYRAVSLNRDFGSSGHLELMFRGPTSGVGFGF